MSEVLRLRPDQLEWRLVDGEVVILDLRHQRFLSLNPSGALLWKMLVDGPATRAELADRLVAGYGIDAVQAAGDVDQLIESLAAESLLQIDDAAP